MFGSADQWDGLGVFFDANTGGKVSFWPFVRVVGNG